MSEELVIDTPKKRGSVSEKKPKKSGKPSRSSSITGPPKNKKKKGKATRASSFSTGVTAKKKATDKTKGKKKKESSVPDVFAVKKLLKNKMRSDAMRYEDVAWVDRVTNETFPSLWHLVAALYPPEMRDLEYKTNMDDQTFHIPPHFCPEQSFFGGGRDDEDEWGLENIGGRQRGMGRGTHREVFLSPEVQVTDGIELGFSSVGTSRPRTFLSVEEAIGYHTAQAEIQARHDFGAEFVTILNYVDVINEMLDELSGDMVSAEKYNTTIKNLSKAQMACGVVALGLGVTLIVITAGGATPVVALTGAAMATGFTSAGVTSGIKIAKGKRKEIMKETNKEKWEELYDPKTGKKAARNEVIRKGAQYGMQYGVLPLVIEAVGGGAVDGISGGVFGVVTGPMSFLGGAVQLKNAKKFSVKSLYEKGGAHGVFEAVAINITRFLNALDPDTLQGSVGHLVFEWLERNDEIVAQVRDALRDTLERFEKVHATYKPKKKKAKKKYKAVLVVDIEEDDSTKKKKPKQKKGH